MTKQIAVAPEWDLTDLYSGRDSSALETDFSELESSADKFVETYRGMIRDVSASEFAAAILEYEALQNMMVRIESYSELLHAENLLDTEVSRFVQIVTERLSAITTKLLFFLLEINRLPDSHFEILRENETVERYYPWLRDLRIFRNYDLNNELEELFNDKRVSSSAAWKRLFDETIASLSFSVNDNETSIEETLNYLMSPDRGRRKDAGKALGKVFGENIRIFSLITNILAKDKQIEDRWRSYPAVDSYRHLKNLVEPQVVDALVSAVKNSYTRTSHRYYKLKASWMGLDTLRYWDRNAPLSGYEDRSWSWGEAVEVVLSAYGAFSPELAGIGKQFFDKPWIDAVCRKGKASGAFAHSTVPSVHPYLLLNYQGKTVDVMTLAHELGHGIHQVMAANKGILLAETPLTLAETASVFGEQLTFRTLLNSCDHGIDKRQIIADKVEGMLNTVVRQVAFYDFERRLHIERRSGEISHQRLGEIWLEVQAESLGDAFTFDPEYANFWCYIPHFIHTPFYVYAYAFGECLVNALYGLYLDGQPDFHENYLNMLRSGGSAHHRELLLPFGVDASDPAFWEKGIAVIEGFIDELSQFKAPG